MREIKFRAWFTKRQEMVNVETMNLFSSGVEVGAKVDHEKGGWYTTIQESTNRKTALPGSTQQVPRVNLMQYTGLKDKNGKEIYEGDILKCKVRRRKYASEFDWVGEEVSTNRNYLVEWWESASNIGYRVRDGRGKTMMIKPSSLNTMEAEVIGNIYENPELINS
ncbi:YopX family protein [Cytobacillus massiliigabonensis]|uniref:YopX family protein n=1 Tax=Cytobacillus massiliigabonensis TaxID=1871011 RepID=UPI001F1E7ECF|nr:YopX family protein [Cytobacillus massiliigabonensis]